MLRNTVKERMISPEKRRGDFLDQAIDDMQTESYLTEDFLVYFLFGILFASFESVSALLSLTLKLLAEHPTVLQQMTVCIHNIL